MNPAALLDLPLWIDLGVVFVVGLFFGSFFSVVVLRLPEGESIISPASRCPECEEPIRWYDNIPVVSWLLLVGECRHCGEPVPSFYPLMELGTGLLAALTWYLATDVLTLSLWQKALVLAIAALLWLIALIDQRTMAIPDHLNFPLIGLALVYGATPLNHFSETLQGGWNWEVLLAGVGAAAAIAVFAWFGAMGWGDVLLALAMGFLLGRWVGPALAAGVLSGGLVATAIYLFYKLTGRETSGIKMPFGPWLCLGTYAALFFGPQMWGWYRVNFLAG